MSIAEKKTVFDGCEYLKGEEIPDFGSFTATSVDGEIRNYEGLSRDLEKLPNYKEKLPKYQNLETGSSAFCIDTGQLFKYEKTTKSWYETGE